MLFRSVRAVDGLAAAVDRAKALVDAGADAVFPEALEGLREFEAMADALDVPILANMTEFGKGELHTADELASAGVKIVIYPVTLLRLAMGEAERGLDEIAAAGTQAALLDRMQHRRDLYDLIDYEGYSQFDDSIYTFDLTKE